MFSFYIMWMARCLCITNLGNKASCTTYLSIITHHVHPMMETLFPDGIGLFQQDNTPCHKVTMAQECFEDEFKVLTRPPNTSDLSPPNFYDLKDLLPTSWCQIPQKCSSKPTTFPSALTVLGVFCANWQMFAS